MGKYSRGISILVSIAMTCSLVACGSNSNSGQTVSKTGGSNVSELSENADNSDSEAYSDLKLMYKTGKDKGKIREEIKE